MDKKHQNNQNVDKKEVINLAETYAKAVKEKFGKARVILFGSYAKGNYNKDSDIDIAVILKDYEYLNETQLDLMRLRRNIDSRIEPHPFREKDFNINNPIVNEILEFGHIITPQRALS